MIAFVESLTNTAGANAGKPFLLREWQKEFVRALYDPVHADGTRIVRTAVFSVARKNGKTELIAALALAHLCGPVAELGGQIYSAATEREQAALIYAAAAAMVHADPELSSRLNVIDSKKRIVDYRSGSFYAAISAEVKSKHGYNASVVLYDELAQAKNRDLFDVLTTSMGARAEPLTLVISTQSNDPNHVMSEMIDYGMKVESGEFDDPTFRCFVYAVPDDVDDVFDEAVWYQANPALGDFRSLEEMRAFARKAQRMPSAEATFRNLYLNQRVSSSARLINAVDWRACAGTPDLGALRGRPCFAGLDLSSTNDLTALVLVFPPDDPAAETWVIPFFWLPREGLEDKQLHDRVPYMTWLAQGHLRALPGRAVNKRAVLRELVQVLTLYDLRLVAYDRWRIEDFKMLMADEGVDLPLKEYGQGYKDMAPAVDAVETLLLERRLRHDGNPVLTWCAANAVAETDPAGNRKITKAKATGRVDGVVAMAMGVGVAAKWENPASVYSDREMMVL